MNIAESVEAILKSDDLVGGQFYERFFVECPHLKSYFKGVDMDRQSAMLTSAIILIETMHSKNAAAGLTPYLCLLGRDHQAKGISKEDFTDWTESMLRTLGEFHGNEWTKSLEQEWYQAISGSVKVMLDAYVD